MVGQRIRTILLSRIFISCENQIADKRLYICQHLPFREFSLLRLFQCHQSLEFVGCWVCVCVGETMDTKCLVYNMQSFYCIKLSFPIMLLSKHDDRYKPSNMEKKLFPLGSISIVSVCCFLIFFCVTSRSFREMRNSPIAWLLCVSSPEIFQLLPASLK